MTRFARRAVGGEIRANELTRTLAAGRAAGARLLDLTASNPTDCGLGWPEDVLDAALAGGDSSRYRPEPFGLFKAREAICEDLARRGVFVEPERLLLTASTSEAYSFLLKLLCDPGDAVAVPRPGYPLLEWLARFDSVGLHPYTSCYDGSWHLDAASLAAVARERTRAVVVVSPNNPTGSFVSWEDLEKIAATGLPIIADEVFADYAWAEDRTRPRSVLEARDSLVFRLDGLSKSCVLPQLKLAWMAVGGPADLVSDAMARLEHIADAYLSVATPVQLALPALLAEAPRMREQVRARCRNNLMSIFRVNPGTAVTPLRGEGGWSAVLRLPDLHDDEDWALLLLESDGVLVHPGYFYDFPEGAHVVVSLLTLPEVFAEGLLRLAERVGVEAS